MSIFDSLKRQAESSIKREASKAVRGAVNSAVQSVGKGRNRYTIIAGVIALLFSALQRYGYYHLLDGE